MMDGQQRDFEAWAKKHGFDLDFRGGGYSSPATSGAWLAWRHWTQPQTHCHQGDCPHFGRLRPASCVCAIGAKE
jgi:hypothetical protein